MPDGPWSKYAQTGPWAKYGGQSPEGGAGEEQGTRPPASAYPDWYVRSSDLRANNYKVASPGPRDADAAILRKRGFREDEVARILSDKAYHPGQYQGLEDLAGPGTRGGAAQSGKIGRLFQGITDLGVGAAVVSAHSPLSLLPGAPGPEAMDALDRIRKQQIEENSQPGDMSLPVVGDPLRLLGGALVPLPGGAAAKGVSKLKNLIGGAARGVGYSQLQPVGDVAYDESGESNYLEKRAEQAVVGGLLTPALERGARSAGNLLRERAGARPGDVRLETLGSDIEARRAGAIQQEIAQLEAVARGGGDRAATAGKLAKRLRDVGDDLGENVQASTEARKLLDKLEIDPLYAKRDQLVGNPTGINVDNTVAAIDAAIAELSSANYPHPAAAKIANELQVFKSKISPTTKSTPSSVLDPYGQPARTNTTTTTPPNEFSALSRDRSTLGDRISQAIGGEPLGSNEIRLLQGVKKALGDDLSVAVKGRGSAAEAADEAARAAYAKYAARWDEDARLANSMLKTETPDLIAGKMFRGKSATGALKMFNSLTPSGREAARKQIVDDLLEVATQKEGTTSHFQVDKLLTTLGNNEKTLGVVFGGMDAERLAGLKHILDAAQRKASRAGGTVGGAAAGAGIGGMAGGNVVPGAVVGGTLGFLGGGTKSFRGIQYTDRLSSALYYLMSSPRGQSILLKSSKMKPGSPALERLLLEIERQSGRAGGVAARDLDE